ncbi:MAG: zf-HC2 domain-containing protein [Acidobacteria bacterium]|nr:zf-HC2 domain-containing protein [Acidobacteriota bacterium]
MRDATMDCRRVEELLSDHREGLLEEPLCSELAGHLVSCAACRELSEAVGEVVAALRAHPVLEPPAGLAERAAAAALARSRQGVASRVRRVWRRPEIAWRFALVPAPLQAVAAAAAFALTGLVLAATSDGATRAADRLKERTVNATVYLAERRERLVEDFRILRVVVGTAFGSRLDRVNDRVEDYRRLLERRRAAEQDSKKTGREPHGDLGTRSAAGPFPEHPTHGTRSL